MASFDQTNPEKNRRHRTGLFRGIGLTAGTLTLTVLLGACGRSHYARDRAGLSPEKMEERLSKVFHRALSRVDATREQQTKVDAMLRQLSPKVLQLQKERKGLRDQLVGALEADKVSREQLLEIKSASLALAARVIDRSIEVVLELSDALTPEQRKKLIEAWKKRS